ncbi:winged helix-turn-helix transcriptional regulator [Pseudonocardia sp. GCM10023141]
MALFDVIGQRWTLRIMWELHSHAPLTFRELQQRCGGLSSSVLSGRLDVLREVRLATATPAGYQLTGQGESLTTHLLPLSRWSEQWVAELDAG